MLPLFDWERAVWRWVVLHTHSKVVKVLKVLNIWLGGEEGVTLRTPWLTAGVLWLHGPEVAVLFLAALLVSRHVEAWAKPLFGTKRGRPRDPVEPGLPSGDCAVTTIWALNLLGVWGVIPITIVVWARMALRAHWPLDTVAGIAQGVILSLPALGWSILKTWT